MHTLEPQRGQLVSFQSGADSLGVKSDQSNRQRQSLVKHLLLEIDKSRQNICRPWQPKYVSGCKYLRVSLEKLLCQDDFLLGRKCCQWIHFTKSSFLFLFAAVTAAQQCTPLQTSILFSNKPFYKQVKEPEKYTSQD